MTGVSCGLLFTLALSVISQWFERRAGLAFGVVALGSSIGGTTFPIAPRRLILEIRFPWTMRILGFIQIATLIVANICLMQRLPPQNKQGPFVTMRPLRSLPFALYFISQTTTFLGLNTRDFCWYFANFLVLSRSHNQCCVVPWSTRWRLIDMFGSLDVMIPATFLAGVLIYAWPFVTT